MAPEDQDWIDYISTEDENEEIIKTTGLQRQFAVSEDLAGIMNTHRVCCITEH